MRSLHYICVGTCVLVLAGATGYAQQQVYQNGHALDANNQVGSGGTNSPVQGYVPINGNDIITGNVTGLGYFHGRAGTQNPYEYRAGLGSGSLNNFERQSALPPVPGAFAGNVRPFYSANTITTGTDVQGNLVRPIGAGLGGSTNAVNPSESISPNSRLAQSPDASRYSALSARLNLSPSRSEITSQDNGGLTTPAGEVNALYGLRLLQRNPLAVASTRPAQARQDNRTDENQTPGEETENGDRTPRTDQIAKPVGRGTREKPVQGEVRVGSVGTEVGSDALVGRTNTPEARRPADPYQALLTALQARERERTNPMADTTQPAGLVPRLATATQPGGRGAATQRGGGRGEADRLSNAARGPREKGQATVEDLRAGRELPPLNTLAGAKVTPYNELMARAEASLKKGQYLFAVDQYEGAMSEDPANPLGLIGRAHAELGAGLFEASTYDLLSVYQQHPNLAAVRYDIKSFLPAARIGYLQKDLAHLQQAGGAASSFFLTAYLDYQAGDEAAMNQALDAWAKKRPADKWPAVLRAAWGK